VLVLLGLLQQSLRTARIDAAQQTITIRPLHPTPIGKTRVAFDDIERVELTPAPPFFLARFARNPAATAYIPVLHLKDGTQRPVIARRNRRNATAYTVRRITKLL